MEKAEFQKLVEEGVDLVPEEFLKKLKNVAIVIEENPSDEQRRKTNVGQGSLLLGLYEGVPQTKRGANYGLVLPDKITIFQKQIEQTAFSPEEIKIAVRDTVWHEIAHHFGSGERGAAKAARRLKK